jgi:hypothetical protein
MPASPCGSSLRGPLFDDALWRTSLARALTRVATPTLVVLRLATQRLGALARCHAQRHGQRQQSHPHRQPRLWSSTATSAAAPSLPRTSLAARSMNEHSSKRWWVERALRGLVVGHKTQYRSRSRRGTEVAALFYSRIETAKLRGLDPRK